MTQTLTYVGLYIILSIVSALILFCGVSAFVLLLSLALKLVSERAAGNVMAISTVLCPLIVAPLPYIALAYNWNYYPPYPKVFHLQQQASSMDKDLHNIQVRANGIRDRLNKLDELSLKQVKPLLEESTGLLGEMKTEVERQRSLIAALSQAAADESDKAAKAQEQVERLQTLTQEQGDAVAVTFVRALEDESRKSFLLGILVSFPVGVISSLMASFIYRKLGDKTRAVLKAHTD